jgi:ABC-type uncharacterized transport system permease subunit
MLFRKLRPMKKNGLMSYMRDQKTILETLFIKPFKTKPMKKEDLEAFAIVMLAYGIITLFNLHMWNII